MRVVVCGAGIAGLTFANRMSSSGHEVVLLDRAPGPRPQGYMIDFFGPGLDALDAMGLLPAVDEVRYHVDEATLVDGRGRRTVGVRTPGLAGGTLVNVLRPDLEGVLRARLPAGVDVRYGTGPVAVTDRGDRVEVALTDGSTLGADLLVGADGVHSTVRRLVFGDEREYLRYLGFHTAAFLFDAPRVHAATRGRFTLTDTVGRQMGFYGLRDGRVATFAVHRTPDPTTPADVRESVRDTYRGLGWIVPEALDLCPPSEEIYYDQVSQVHVPEWSRGRVVLIGDACHAVSLLAGQGASLGVAGAYVLADQLTRAPVDRATAAYERLWRPVVEERQRVGRAGARWFLPASAVELVVRRAALRLTRFPAVSRWVAATIVGKSTDVVTTPRREPIDPA
ncbi:FAD-dependent monooxygenase [Umezawaea endophytica]|uniref:FAD-dependent monooxygenase n=1 Tax=Umezawaea endophytica TaxID=1654476 RepID=A0A9X2VEK3_9PSEU|nr:FAD-dependent monooxygenase [Umezawaea endophytica]MCS7475248.1 FAD-dependent monooxygenase [Umezawaea endophytica]